MNIKWYKTTANKNIVKDNSIETEETEENDKAIDEKLLLTSTSLNENEINELNSESDIIYDAQRDEEEFEVSFKIF